MQGIQLNILGVIRGRSKLAGSWINSFLLTCKKKLRERVMGNNPVHNSNKTNQRPWSDLSKKGAAAPRLH